MTIDFHCSSCSGKVAAPENAGGRRGKCPYCGSSVYIPMPPDPAEEINIAPFETDAKHEDELFRESISLTGGLEKELSEPMDDSPGEVIDFDAEVRRFVLALRDSKLDIADGALAKLKKQKVRAKNHVEAMINDPVPPVIQGVPAPLLKGFLQKLNAELN